MTPRTALTPPASPRAGLQPESEPGDCSELPPLQPPPASGTPTSPALCWVRMWTHSERKKGGVASAGVGSKARLRASSIRRSFSPPLSFLTRSPALLLSLLDAQSQRAHGSTQTPRHTISLLSLAHTHTITGWHHRGSSKGRRTHTTHMTQCETAGLALKRTAFLLPCSPPLSPPPPLLKPSC